MCSIAIHIYIFYRVVFIESYNHRIKSSIAYFASFIITHIVSIYIKFPIFFNNFLFGVVFDPLFIVFQMYIRIIRGLFNDFISSNNRENNHCKYFFRQSKRVENIDEKQTSI